MSNDSSFIPVDELLSAQSSDEVFALLLDILEQMNVPAKSWRKGGALRTILRAAALVTGNWTRVLSSVAKFGFIDEAEGAWLTLLALYVYGVERKPATFATGSLLFVNASGSVFSATDYPAGSIRATNPDTGRAYINAEPISLGANETKSFAFSAVEQGAASSAAPSTLALETPLLGVTATNPTAIIGQDEEADSDLRQACMDRLAWLANKGMDGGYRYAIRTATRSDGTLLNFNRVQVSEASSTGQVRVWCAQPSGTPSSADLDVARAAIEDSARTAAVNVTVMGAAEVAFGRTVTVWVRRTPGLDTEALRNQVQLACATAVSSYPIGGYAKPPLQLDGALYADFIAGTAKAESTSIFDVDIDPPGDLILGDGNIATLALNVQVKVV